MDQPDPQFEQPRTSGQDVASIEESRRVGPRRDEAPNARRRARFARLCMIGAIAVGLLVAGVWVRHRWLVVTYRIAGGSMAETLVGDHVRLVCTDCGFSFRCGSTEVPRDNVLNCPNCGQPHEVDDRTEVRRGQAAAVDRWPVIVGGPQRWDLVAIAQPGSPGEFAVKRVVGLPGELVTIANGRVLIGSTAGRSDDELENRHDMNSENMAAIQSGGEVVRKPWATLRESAVTIYDDTHRARRIDSPPRWTPREKGSRWRTTDAGYRFSASPNRADDSRDRNNWLDYRHYPTFAPAGSAASRLESPIVDHDAYNQSVSRRMNRVTDLGVSCRVTLGRESRIAWQFVDDEDDHAIRVELSNTPRQVRIFSSTRSRGTVGESGRDLTQEPDSLQLEHTIELAREGASPNEHAVVLEVEVAVRGPDVYVILDGRELTIHRIDVPTTRQTRQTAPTSRSAVAISASGESVEVERLKLWRDVFYLDPLGEATRWTTGKRLGPDEYFVLGDNPVLSIDSRNWPPGSVTRSSLLGIVRPIDE